MPLRLLHHPRPAVWFLAVIATLQLPMLLLLVTLPLLAVAVAVVAVVVARGITCLYGWGWVLAWVRVVVHVLLVELTAGDNQRCIAAVLLEDWMLKVAALGQVQHHLKHRYK